jgi:hypothetical protein
MLDTTVAIQSAWNTGSRSGLQADKRLPASFPSGSLAKGIFLADFDILLDDIPKTYTVTGKCLVALVIRKQPSRCGVNAVFVNRSYKAPESTCSDRLLFEYVLRPENKRGRGRQGIHSLRRRRKQVFAVQLLLLDRHQT